MDKFDILLMKIFILIIYRKEEGIAASRRLLLRYWM